MRRLFVVLTLIAAACAGQRAAGPVPSAPPPPDAADPIASVDPFIGTGGHGHTFPGATLPFGMVQLSPDTRVDGSWDGCSGYHRSDEFIYGFSHTHLSGTGCSDYGDVLVMPGIGPHPEWNNGADGRPGYRRRFRRAEETAAPGYYAVTLDTGVRAELTATPRTGLHRYTFPAGTPDTDAHLVIDLSHRDEVLDAAIDISDGDDDGLVDGQVSEITGFRRSSAWAKDQHTHFVMRFSHPIAAYQIGTPKGADGRRVPGPDTRLDVTFMNPKNEPVGVTVAISGVDVAGARRNLEREAVGLSFDAARIRATDAWRKALGKIAVRGGTPSQHRTFHTALYHAMIAPNVWSDVDGRYRGRDGKIHEATGRDQYTVFSLWDTFRALHPLLTILEPRRTEEFVATFIAQHEQGGALPVWELAANETDCMIGYHAVPVIADAWAKGLRGFDANAALDAMAASARRDVRGLPAYRRDGCIPSEEESESVSKTLEYAYDDWCIASMAKSLGRDDLAAEFGARAQSWKNLLDPATGFFRARRNHAWVTPFDPAEVNFHLTEANSWQYSLFVPHDVGGHMAALGGRDAFARRVDALFSAPSATTGREQADITGLIGQYAHGNEPSHHMAYIHVFAGEPWKTQARVRQILDTLYSDAPDGLCGNEDCGQMSAWYVFSALGFYPVTPGLPEYVIGAPLFPEAAIDVGGGRTFTVRATGDGPFVQSVTLNGAELRRAVLPHAALVAGGELSFVMGREPSRWGADDPPRTPDAGPRIVPVPFVAQGERVFRGAMDVAFGALEGEVLVSRDGAAPVTATAPIRIDRTTEFTAFARTARGDSKRITARFVRIADDRTVAVQHPWAPQYAANGPNTLVDGLRGAADFRTGDWQGTQREDVDATIDLGAVRDVRRVRTGFLQDQGSWIWLPASVAVTTSADGVTWTPLSAAAPSPVGDRADGAIVHRYEFAAPAAVAARYVRIVGTNRGTCPPWHPGAGHAAWLFADEFEVE